MATDGNQDSWTQVKALCGILKDPQNRPALLEVLQQIEEFLDGYPELLGLHSNVMGAPVIRRSPAFEKLCSPWAAQVFGVVLLARMKAEGAKVRTKVVAGHFPHHSYKRRHPQVLVPEVFVDDICLP